MAARNGPPLAIGHGSGEIVPGSDAIALWRPSPMKSPISSMVTGPSSARPASISSISTAMSSNVRARFRRLCLSGGQGQPSPFSWEKEIYEQPGGHRPCLGALCEFHRKSFVPISDAIDFGKVPSLAISACGTAYLAGLIGKYWFERYARLPVEIDVASEFRYREIPLSPQSGGSFHLAVGRDRRHTGVPEIFKEHASRSARWSMPASRASRGNPMRSFRFLRALRSRRLDKASPASLPSWPPLRRRGQGPRNDQRRRGSKRS
ncbi:hypothetical protein F2981_30295 (plasmid) [Sinorhizobium meliloti]|nr:hypothetical protein [Sinorhizobium meliloti]